MGNSVARDVHELYDAVTGFLPVGANLLMARKCGPYRIKTNGMGVMSNAKHPSRVDAQRGFSFSYMFVANKGNTAPDTERRTVFAASADAATCRYTSTI